MTLIVFSWFSPVLLFFVSVLYMIYKFIDKNVLQYFNKPPQVNNCNVNIIHSINLPDDTDHVSLNFQRMPVKKQLKESEDFLNSMQKMIYAKKFSSRKVPTAVIENVIKSAGTAPSGVHTEPWTFAVVTNANLKRQIRYLVEVEEFKQSRKVGQHSQHWRKPYLEDAPCLIIVLKQIYGLDECGQRKNHYQNQLTVAVATGILIVALQNVGLATYPCCVPFKAGYEIKHLLKRPVNEKILFVLPVGYAEEKLQIENRKLLSEIMQYIG